MSGVTVGIYGMALRVRGESVDEAFAAFERRVWDLALGSLPRPMVDCDRHEQVARRWVSGHDSARWYRAALRLMPRGAS